MTHITADTFSIPLPSHNKWKGGGEGGQASSLSWILLLAKGIKKNFWLIQLWLIIHRLKKKNLKYSPKIGRGRGEKLEKQTENYWKDSFFFYRILRPEEGYYKSEICDWRYSIVPRTIWKTAPLKPGKYSIFPVLSIFFYLSLLIIRHSHPNKSYFLKISKTMAISSQSFKLLFLEV